MITDGRSHDPDDPQTGFSSSLATIVAFSFITSTRARLNETTASGSYPAFKTNVRIVILSRRLHGLQAIECIPDHVKEGVAPNKKAPPRTTVPNFRARDSARTVECCGV
jgi:hypothetical protein